MTALLCTFHSMSRAAPTADLAYNGVVRFRTGLLVGLAIGYYYGTKAGPERYRQIDQYLAQVRATDAYRDLRDRVGSLMDDGISRSRGLVEDAVFGTSGTTDESRVPFDYTGDPTLN